jgi:hypothetical protein
MTTAAVVAAVGVMKNLSVAHVRRRPILISKPHSIAPLMACGRSLSKESSDAISNPPCFYYIRSRTACTGVSVCCCCCWYKMQDLKRVYCLRRRCGSGSSPSGRRSSRSSRIRCICCVSGRGRTAVFVLFAACDVIDHQTEGSHTSHALFAGA